MEGQNAGGEKEKSCTYACAVIYCNHSGLSGVSNQSRLDIMLIDAPSTA
jgi:hypothetical protein